jgi:hypothetical protein
MERQPFRGVTAGGGKYGKGGLMSDANVSQDARDKFNEMSKKKQKKTLAKLNTKVDKKMAKEIAKYNKRNGIAGPAAAAPGFFERSKGAIMANKGKSALIAGAVLGTGAAGYYAYRKSR